MKYFLLTKRSLVSLAFCLMIGAAAAAVTVSSAVKAVQTAAEPKQVPVYRVEPGQNRVAISFDAAWGDEQTEELLDILDENNAKATFFLVGDWVDKYPDDVKLIRSRGHDIGNHSDTHPHMPQLGLSGETNEVRACNDKIKALTGSAPTLFRAPYGDYDNNLVSCVKGLGMYCVQWDVDSLDWMDPSPEELCENVLGKVKDGSIVLMHNGAKNTPAALPSIIKGIRAKGLEIVLIKDLIPEGEYYTDAQGELHLSE